MNSAKREIFLRSRQTWINLFTAALIWLVRTVVFEVAPEGYDIYSWQFDCHLWKHLGQRIPFEEVDTESVCAGELRPCAGAEGKFEDLCIFFNKNIKLGWWHVAKLFSPITDKTSKYSILPCVWFLILISFDDTWFFELHFRSPVTFHSCTPGKEKYLRLMSLMIFFLLLTIFLMTFSYQSLWCWWQHMNSQRSLGCSWLRFSIGFRPGQIGFLNVSFLKTYWSSDQLNLTKLPM